MFSNINSLLTRIKKNRPLILNLTNHVTMDFIANGLLSLGASPIMTEAIEEMEALANLAHAIVINIGTLNEPFIARVKKACELACLLGKPLLLDPVGAGATPYRTDTALELLQQFRFNIIRGNASEINALAGITPTTKGVDSQDQTRDAIESAQFLSSKYGSIIAISGKTDAVVKEQTIQYLHYGSPIMPFITGSGCLLTATIAAFISIHNNDYEAASSAIAFYGLSGEKAASYATLAGSFKIHFLDCLSLLLETESDDPVSKKTHTMCS